MNDAQPTNYSAALKALMRSQQRHNALLSLAGSGTWEIDVRKIGGTGLGLAIALELVHGMSGTLSYVKPKGDGAAFRLVFPVASGE